MSSSTLIQVKASAVSVLKEAIAGELAFVMPNGSTIADLIGKLEKE